MSPSRDSDVKVPWTVEAVFEDLSDEVLAFKEVLYQLNKNFACLNHNYAIVDIQDLSIEYELENQQVLLPCSLKWLVFYQSRSLISVLTLIK